MSRAIEATATGRGRRIGRPPIGLWLTLLAILLVWLLPIVWALATSFKERPDIFTLPPRVTFSPTLANYVSALTTRPILANLRDSLIIAVTATVIALAVAVPAGYAYARLEFRFKHQVSFFLLFMQMIPLLGLIVPFFLILTGLRWSDTYQGLVLINLGVMVPTATWLMITYFQDLPREVEEAAAVDGATRWQTFVQVVLPQAGGGVAVTAIFSYLWVWNEFLFAVILSGSRVRPITVGMYGFLQFEESLWGPLMATAVMAMAPVVVGALLVQRHIIRGLTLGAVK